MKRFGLMMLGCLMMQQIAMPSWLGRLNNQYGTVICAAGLVAMLGAKEYSIRCYHQELRSQGVQVIQKRFLWIFLETTLIYPEEYVTPAEQELNYLSRYV